RPSITAFCAIGQRPVQQVAVKKDDCARFNFDRNGVFIFIGEIKGLFGAIEARIRMLPLRPEDTSLVRTGNHPQAAVLDSGVIQSDPAAAQRSIPRGYIILVLVPCLTGLTSGFNE